MTKLPSGMEEPGLSSSGALGWEQLCQLSAKSGVP